MAMEAAVRNPVDRRLQKLFKVRESIAITLFFAFLVRLVDFTEVQASVKMMSQSWVMADK